MFVYQIIDTAERKQPLGYATTAEEASDLAKRAADHYASLDFSGEIEVHRLKTDELYLGGIYWETLIETVPFVPCTQNNC